MSNLSKEINIGIHNRFDIEVIDSITGKLKQKVQAFNVVCNRLFNNICSNNNNSASYLVYGSGSGSPSASDTSLFTYINYVGRDSLNYDYSREYMGIVSSIQKFILNANVAVGANITEVGLSYDSRNGNLGTHAMLQDMNGNPISILKTDTDIINIYATIYLHYDQSHGYHAYNTSSVGCLNSILIGAGYKGGSECWSESYSTTWLIAGKNQLLNGYYRDNPGKNKGTDSYCTSTSSTQTISGDGNRTITLSGRFDVTDANCNGLKKIGVITGIYNWWFGNGYRYMLVFENGVATQSFSITNESIGTGDGLTTKFKTHTDCPYNATVYINGIETNNVTVLKAPVRVVGNNTVYYETVYSQDPNIPNNGYPGDDFTILAANVVYKNTLYESKTGFRQINIPSGGVFKASNDGNNWTTLVSASSSTTYTLTNNDLGYKFYKCENVNGNIQTTNSDYDGYNIIFDTPPADGDVITIDYTTDYIPKDSDHILDISLTLQFGEYTPT